MLLLAHCLAHGEIRLCHADERRLAALQRTSFEVVDDYTFRFNLSKWINPSVMIHSYAYAPQIYSPSAWLNRELRLSWEPESAK